MVDSSTPDASTAVLSLVVEADPGTVFKAFIDPRELNGWYWPPEFATLYATDPRPGGRFSFRSTGLPAKQNIGVHGIYGEIRRPELLTFIWAWDGDIAPASQVSVSIRPEGDERSKVTVTHGDNASVKQRDDHLTGWHDCLARLAFRLNVDHPLLEDA